MEDLADMKCDDETNDRVKSRNVGQRRMRGTEVLARCGIINSDMQKLNYMICVRSLVYPR
jgi:hypothetical protein